MVSLPAIEPPPVERILHLAQRSLETGDTARAFAFCRRALAVDPGHAGAMALLAALEQASGRHEAAVHLFKKAMAVNPLQAEWWNSLGVSFRATGKLDDAEMCYRRALDIFPLCADAAFNLGNTLKQMGRLEEAIQWFERANQLQPGQPDILTNLGATLRDNGRFEESLSFLQLALEAQSDYPEAHWNRALTLLALGEYVEGWEEYEWRWRVRGLVQTGRKFMSSTWDGTSPQGKTILVHAEQGFGDMVQFIRYVPLLAARGARVIVDCPEPLLELFRTIEGAAEVVTWSDPVTEFDGWVPLMSLPRYFSTSLNDVPNCVPYLRGAGCKGAETISLSNGGLRVGFVWSGNRATDARRSVPLDLLVGALSVTGAELYSLQVGDCRGELAGLSTWATICDLGGQFRNFADTATAIENLDLIVTVDTSVAHLAGALGKPVWVLLPGVADWRWLTERADSPWYPTARLFRQSEDGDWGGVCARVRTALEDLCSERVGGSGELPRGHGETPKARMTLLPPQISADAIYNRGLAFHECGELENAINCYRTALKLDRQHTSARLNLGVALKQQNNLAGAAECYREILSRAPQHSDAANNLGTVLQAQDQLVEATRWYRAALRSNPSHTGAQLNLAIVLREQGCLEEAMSWHRRTLAAKPDCAEAHWNLGFALLLAGRMTEGWDEYEWRWRMSEMKVKQRAFGPPKWNGEDLAGRVILIHAEQGLGDTLQFARYAPMIAARKGRVILECQPELVSLMRSLAGISIVVPRGARLPEFDCHAQLLSLPRLFRTTLNNIPGRTPYLRSREADERFETLIPRNHFNVGLVWGGNPKFRNDRTRSFALNQYGPLLDMAGVRFHSLQVGERSFDLAAFGGKRKINDLSPYLIDFTATAAAVGRLDLVITSDTSVAHLAGALGKRVWVLLSHAPDWRWLLERDDSPWYPTMRLFRQSRRGDWPGVMRRVHDALLGAVKNASADSPGCRLVSKELP